MKHINHIWFDLEGTLTPQTPEFHRAHDTLRYEVYAQATGRPLTQSVAQEFEALYREKGSNSAVFRSIGLPSDYWMRHRDSIDPADFNKPDPKIYGTLQLLKDRKPISLFTNFRPDYIARSLETINVDPAWFTHILSGDDVPERKPAPDGFQAMIKLTAVPAGHILYVGDRVDADIKPAKKLGIQTCLMWSESGEADVSLSHFQDLLSLL
jgi:HAD superfamily hydrolase (TIGR01549 family)